MVIKSLFFLKISLKNKTFQRKKHCRVCSVPPWWEMNLTEFKYFVPRPLHWATSTTQTIFFFNNCYACMVNTEYCHWVLPEMICMTFCYDQNGIFSLRSIYCIKMVYWLESIRRVPVFCSIVLLKQDNRI